MTPSTAKLPFTIRAYRAADFPRLWEIDQLCFPPGIAYTQMDLTGFITRRNAITLVAELEPGGEVAPPEAIVGFAVAQPSRKIGRILTLDVAPTARRFGLGSHLLQACEQRLHAAHCTEIYLETAVDNEPALRLYQKLGYQVLRTLPDYYPSHRLDAFLLGKRL